METDQNLNSTDFGNAGTAAVATVAMNLAARRGPKWLRWLVGVFTVIIVVATGAGLIDKITSMGKLPACDGQRTRDTLSDLNFKNKVNASSYNFIKQVSASDTEVTCTANLALRNGGTLEYDYRIFKGDSEIKVEITNWRPL